MNRVTDARGDYELLRSVWRHLSRRRHRQFYALFALLILGATAEIVSLGAVLPFVAILTSPKRVFKIHFVAHIAQSWGINSPTGLVLPLTIAFGGAALASGSIRMLLSWASIRFAYASGADISIEVYRRTLYQPYSVHVARNSSDVISGITQKVDGVVEVLNHIFLLLTSAVVLLAIMGTLLAIDPVIAAVATVSFGMSYGSIAWLSRRRLHRNSRRIANEQTRVLKALQEGLGGIRDVLLDGTQPLYCDIYTRADAPLRRAQGNNFFIAASPRFAMEAVGMILVALLAYSLRLRPGGIGAALPVIGAVALGAQRMIPALQQGYHAWATIVGRRVSVAMTLHLLDQPVATELFRPPPRPMGFVREIRFESVRFRYSEEGPWVLDGVGFAIPRGARVGIVGGTGSGKTTTLDLLMGLLLPTAGTIEVDGAPLQGELIRAWQRTIAHVPQAIYLADASIAENIALGTPPDAIDMDRVRRAARRAQIAEFIESRAEGYAATVGERGVRLSGGQRQRIGIARALYKEAGVLIFDEATSALDTTTEQSVMRAIDDLDRDLTILLIAHRLSTVRRCDVIMELGQGRMIAHGTYDELLECSPTFRRMALAAS